MPNAILYLAYGGAAFIDECRFSLLKYLQVYNFNPPHNTGIFIYTDRPDAFSDFEPYFHQLECRSITPEKITAWRGQIDFVHRVKIETMADFLESFEGSFLYCDTDTYITAPLDEIFVEINKGNYFMHEFEGLIDKTKSFRKWEKFLSTASLDFNGKKFQFRKGLQMFNAGVVGLHSSDREVLNDVLALTDAVYHQFPKHVAEQFAFSYCLQRRGLIKEAAPIVAHYWNLKEFRQLLSVFFSKNMEESITQLVKKISHIDALSMMREKMNFMSLPIWKRVLKNISGSGWSMKMYEKKILLP